LHGRFQNPFAFAHSPMTGRKASGDIRRGAARAGSDFFFGLERGSVRSSNIWCIQTKNLYRIDKSNKI
jgi:hypothetical protein